MQTEQTSGILTIEQQKKITLTGVESVDAFSDTSITLTASGKRVYFQGAGLKILSFSKGSGAFSATGEVYSVKFGGAKGSFKKLFK